MTIPTIPVMQWTRITKLLVDFPVTTLLANGTPATITGVQCALLPYRSRGPSANTIWKDAVWAPGDPGAPGLAKILISGPDASDPGSAGFRLDTTTGGDLWARVVDVPEIQPGVVARIDLMSD